MRISLLISFLCLFIVTNLNGQIQKKTLMVGGEMDISFASKSYRSFNFDLTPTLGYFVIENLSIGIRMETGYLAFEDEHASSFGIGPLARYYFGGDRLMGFGHFSYVGSIHSFSNIDENRKSHIIQPGVGVNFLLLPSVGIEAIASFNYDFVRSDYYYDIRVGFQVFFPPKNPN